MFKFLLLFGYGIIQAVNATAQQQPSQLYNMVTATPAAEKVAASTQLFKRSTTIQQDELASTLLTQQLLDLDKNQSAGIYQSQPGRLSITVPYAHNRTYILQLVQQDISFDGLTLYTLTGTGSSKKAGKVKAVHYRGYIEGFPASIAAVSVFANGEIMAIFSSEEGNFNLGKINNKDEYIVYNSMDMRSTLGYECGAAMLPVISTSKEKRPAAPSQPQGGTLNLLCKKVRFHWEVDYKLYNNNFSGNLNNTANYIAGLFNQLAAMYANEGILVELNSTFIWTTPDPYNTSTADSALATLKRRYNALGDNFNGDLCMLIDGAPTNNGGLAYILDFDQCNRAFAYGYANVYATYNTVPTYSWDVEVMTHESGHLMGSFHTQWCGWNTGAGNTCGAIDNCFAVEAGPGCSTCISTVNTNPSAPPGFMGTVMSYCYLRDGIGVNLSYGFGAKPQARIRSCVNAAACFIPDSKWTGTVSTAWENAANWSCGAIPTVNTDVTISGGAINYPVVNSPATCRKLNQKTNTTVTVRTGFSLSVAGRGN